MAPACRNGRSVLVPECHFQKGLFFMNYFYKIAVSLTSGEFKVYTFKIEVQFLGVENRHPSL